MRLSARTFGRSRTSRPPGTLLAAIRALVASAPPSAQAITPQEGGRYPGDAEFIGECRDLFPAAPPPVGEFDGQRFYQDNRAWGFSHWDEKTGTRVYQAVAEPPDCIATAEPAGEVQTAVPTRPGKHFFIIEHDYRIYEWECDPFTFGRGAWQLVESGDNHPVDVVAFPVFDRYQVSLKARIPHRAAADPSRPAKTRYSLLTENCFTRDPSFEDSTRVRTVFRGNNHNAFPGS
jgi:hypothetical protein